MTQSVVETETLSYSWLPYHTDDNCCLSLSLSLADVVVATAGVAAGAAPTLS